MTGTPSASRAATAEGMGSVVHRGPTPDARPWAPIRLGAHGQPGHTARGHRDVLRMHASIRAKKLPPHPPTVCYASPSVTRPHFIVRVAPKGHVRPAHLTVSLLVALTAGCSSAASLPVRDPSSAAAPSTPEGQAAAVTPPVAPGGSNAHRMTLTDEGAPQLASPTTAREAQSGDAATRCARLASLCLEDVGRMMSFLGATAEQSRVAVDGLRPAYGAGFTDRCATATPEMLTCVETAENVFTGLARCGINRGRAFPDALIRGETFGFEVRWSAEEREVTDAAGADALRAAMVGSWAQRDQGTWTFAADGGATHAQRRLAGAPQFTDTYQLTASSRARIFSDASGRYSAVVEGDLLYWNSTAGGTGYSAAQPIEEDGSAVGLQSGFWAIEDVHGTPRCTGFSWWGQPVQAARCAWEGQGDARRLLIMAGFGHDLLSGEPAAPAQVRFREMGGHLVGNNDYHHYRRVVPGGAAPTP